MNDSSFLIARIKDLAKKALKENVFTSTTFLSLSEQAEVKKVLPSLNKEFLNELTFMFDGGNKENTGNKTGRGNRIQQLGRQDGLRRYIIQYFIYRIRCRLPGNRQDKHDSRKTVERHRHGYAEEGLPAVEMDG